MSLGFINMALLFTIFFMGEILLVITGTCILCASMISKPNPSYKDGNNNNLASL